MRTHFNVGVLASTLTTSRKQKNKRVPTSYARSTDRQTHLPLRDVARQVGDGVRDVIVGHRQDRQLSDRPVAPVHTAGPLVDGLSLIHI